MELERAGLTPTIDTDGVSPCQELCSHPLPSMSPSNEVIDSQETERETDKRTETHRERKKDRSPLLSKGVMDVLQFCYKELMRFRRK